MEFINNLTEDNEYLKVLSYWNLNQDEVTCTYPAIA